MKKLIKFKNDYYLDTTSIYHKRIPLPKLFEDSGELPLSIASGFTFYNSQSECWYRKIGKIVEINASLKPTADISNGGNDKVMFTIPAGFRPKANVDTVCQGSGSNKWLLIILANGTGIIERYGTTSSITVPSGCWLPFHVVYFVD